MKRKGTKAKRKTGDLALTTARRDRAIRVTGGGRTAAGVTYQNNLRQAAITDGTSNTMMFAEQ